MNTTFLISAVAAIVLIFGWAVWCYNSLVRLRKQIDEAWSNVDVQLKRRRDLIPSLVDVVQGYVEHESQLLKRVTEQRSKSGAASGARQTAREESSLSDGISNVLALVEAYPELEADDRFSKLQNTLVDVEDDLQYARRFYNGTVRDFNIRCEQFPVLIVAKIAGFEPEEFFEISLATEREVPDVNLE